MNSRKLREYRLLMVEGGVAIHSCLLTLTILLIDRVIITEKRNGCREEEGEALALGVDQRRGQNILKEKIYFEKAVGHYACCT